MRIEEILNKMDEMIEKSPQMPFSGKKCLVDSKKMSELIDDLRLNLPEILTEANEVVKDRGRIIKDAQIEADNIIKTAQERAKQILSQQEIIRQADEMAREMVATAQKKAAEFRINTYRCLDEMLESTQKILAENLDDITSTRNTLRKSNIK